MLNWAVPELRNINKQKTGNTQFLSSNADCQYLEFVLKFGWKMFFLRRTNHLKLCIWKTFICNLSEWRGQIPETNTLLTHYKVEKTLTKEFGFLYEKLSFHDFVIKRKCFMFDLICYFKHIILWIQILCPIVGKL